MASPRDLPGRQVFNAVVQQSFQTCLFLLGLALVFGWAARQWPSLGRVGFWVLTSIVAFDALHVLVAVLIPAVYTYFQMIKHREIVADEPWLTLATLVRLTEVAFGVVCIWLLASS